MKHFEDVTYYPEFTPAPAEDKSHLFQLSSGVVMPLLQALVSGFSLGCAVGVFCWLLKVPEYWKYGIGTFAGVQAFAWLVLLAKWLRLVAPVERLLNVDIDRDGTIGAPEPETVHIALKHDARRTQFIDLPYPDRLPDFSRSLLAGAPLSESAWCGAGALFSKREFYHLRDELLKSGVIAWKNSNAPAQGLTLTPSGKAVMRYMAGDRSPTEDV